MRGDYLSFPTFKDVQEIKEIQSRAVENFKKAGINLKAVEPVISCFMGVWEVSYKGVQHGVHE